LIKATYFGLCHSISLAYMLAFFKTGGPKMDKRIYIFMSIFLASILFASQITTTNASVTADCYTAFTGADSPPTDFDFNFTCGSAQTVYFGVCDSGFPDDTFTITYKGNVVSESISSGSAQTINIGSAPSDAGLNTATVNMINIPDNISTYSYAVSSDYGEVANYMNTFCGFVVPIPTSISACSETVTVFTQDAAPSDGTLALHILLGNEGARGDEQIMQTWDYRYDNHGRNTSTIYL